MDSELVRALREASARWIKTGEDRFGSHESVAANLATKDCGEWLEMLLVAHDAREGEPSPIHGLSVADGDLADYLWRVLDYYANPYSYIGERTGGILQGCPRGPNPTSQEMTHEAEIAKRRLKAAYDAAQQAAQ